MVRQCVRWSLLAGVLAAAAALPARADDCCAPACATRTVCRTEWVPEQYQTTRTVYSTEMRQEKYTAYRCEYTPETRSRTFTVYKSVQETHNETRNVCERVPAVEERTVMETHWTCKPVTKTVRHCVDRGHYECREVPCCEGRRRFRHHDCCEESCCPPPTRTVNVWVPNRVWEESQVTVMQRICESKPVKVNVNVCRIVMKQETVPVTTWKCVPETKTENYTVQVAHSVPYEASRQVCVRLPHQETVTCTRMVPHTKMVEVPCCEETCAKCCGGRWHRRHRDCCD
jgi:hypothetical protein